MESYPPVDPAELIDLVRSHEVLYNALASDYSNVRLKYELWERIGRRFNMPGDQVKDVWQKLRDCHREALRRKKNRTPSSIKSKLWKYEKEMEFLLPYMKDRARQSSSKQSNPDTETFTYYGNEAGHMLYEVKQELANWSQTEEENSEQDVVMEPVNRKLRRGGKRHQTTDKDQAIPQQQPQQGQPPLQGQLWPEQGDEWESPHFSIGAIQGDPLRQFFDAMYLATMQLPSHLQRRVKRDLFNSVNAAEEEMECSTAHGCSTSTN